MSVPAPSTTPAPAPALPVPSEDILSAKTDLCISNALVKAGLGLGGGIVASAILFRRRPWPVLLGLGFGFGQGYSDCERVFNPAAVPGFVIEGAAPVTAPYAKFNPFGSSTTAKDIEKKVESIAAKVEDKAVEVKEKVVGKAKEVESKVGDKKWV